MKTIYYAGFHNIINTRIRDAGSNVYTIRRPCDPSNNKVIQAKGFWTPDGGWFRVR